MRAIALLALVLYVSENWRTEAWGGLFNRFSPEMLANMGYGAHGGLAQPFIQRAGGGEEGLLEGFEETEDDEPCYGRKCTANEYCCPGQICIDIDGIIGTCLYAYGRHAGELCRRDSDCESGLLCAEADQGTARVCRPPIRQDKQYNELCHMSAECDISRGLCCQLQRRHRQAPRKVCSYFKDPLVCIGPVASDQIKNSIQHTAGEKRITSYKRPMH